MNILVPNLGSTSLKYQLLDMPGGRLLAKGRVERVTDYRNAIAQIDTGDHPVDAVAFKAVHAGPDYRGTFVIEAGVLAALEQFKPAAPAHNAIYLTGIKAFQDSMPDVPLVAAFETEFHSTMPEYAARYGVPAGWEAEGVRKYGFHGASHQYAAATVPGLVGKDPDTIRLISCHLGGSSSLCAIRNGKSIDVTMGFSPQSGLENATRHGDLDVFAVLYMMQRHGWTPAQVTDQLAKTGGLSGLSGIPGGDVRDLETAAEAGCSAAALALDVFVYQVKKTIGAYAAALGGIDAVSFSGGIGENAAQLRRRILSGLEFLGLQLDPAENERGAGERQIQTAGSPAAILVLETNEEIVVARRAYRLLSKS